MTKVFGGCSYVNYITYVQQGVHLHSSFYFIFDFFCYELFLGFYGVSNVHLLQGHLVSSKPYDFKFYPYYSFQQCLCSSTLFVNNHPITIFILPGQPSPYLIVSSIAIIASPPSITIDFLTMIALSSHGLTIKPSNSNLYHNSQLIHLSLSQ